LAGLEFTDAGIGGGGGGDIAEGEVLINGGGIEARPKIRITEKRAKFRGEEKFSPMVGVVERFDAQGIASEDESFFAGVPDGEGEHAVESRETVGPVFSPGLEEDFRIGLGAESGPAGFEIAAEFDVVIDLSIKNDVPASIGGGHGLGSSGEIENAEAAVSEADSGISVGAFGVGPSMKEGVGHSGEGHLRFSGVVSVGGKSSNAAHKIR
jgi:hypothetical protein